VLQKRLVFVTGKGGVGKTTVAAALGIAAARDGARTIVVEVSRQARIARSFGATAQGPREVELMPGLSTVSIDPDSAMQEYLRRQAGRLGAVLAASRVFNYFAAAAPGLTELVTIGKAWELSRGRAHDMVIVDAPASGHAAALLRAPKTFTAVARVGPVARDAHAIHRALTDRRRSGVVLVALPEELSVNETIALRHQLLREPGIAIDAVVANGVYPRRFGNASARRVAAALRKETRAQERAALRAALSERERRRWQEEQLARLSAGIGFEPVELPHAFTPELDLVALDRLSAILAQST
jgi:anion-transporting  ArsA/GET3 family ATPase